MKYTQSVNIGAYVKKDELVNGSSCKIVSETTPQPSTFTNKDGSPKTQDICKVRFEGADEAVNVSVNNATLNGLISAFGEDSVAWQGKALTVETEKMRVAGVARIALYLIPSGYNKVDDDNGYAVVVEIGKKSTSDANKELMQENNIDDIPVIESDEPSEN